MTSPHLPPTAFYRFLTSKIGEVKPVTGASDSSATETISESTLEINTKRGKLVVTAATSGGDSKLDSVIIEKPMEGLAKVVAQEKSDDEVKQALEQELKIKLDVKPNVKKRVKSEVSHSSLERNFITPVRAMSDFLLKPADLEALPKTKRRSPYEQEPPITVYWRKDVEKKAIEVWGSRDNLLKECLKREIEKKMHQQSTNWGFSLLGN